MPSRTAPPESSVLRDGAAPIVLVPAHDEAQLYDPVCEPELAALLRDVAPQAEPIITAFHLGLAGLPRSRNLLKSMSDEELDEFKQWQADNLLGLLSPGLTEASHEAMARDIGRTFALSCITKEELAFAKELLYTAICERVDRERHAQALALLSARMMRDLAWQLTVYQEIHAQRTRLMLSITRLAWEAGSYIDLITNTAELLASHPGITACLIGRSGDMDHLSFEALAGNSLESYLGRVQAIRGSYTNSGKSWSGDSPADRAWRSNRIEHCFNVSTDLDMPPWKNVTMEYGYRSIVAVPLASQPGVGPTAMLGLYSNHIGGFNSDDQIAFLKQLQSLLSYAILRLDVQEGAIHSVPYDLRRRWAALLRSDALCMHYQPVLDLKTRRIVKVETLARLRDGDRMLSPAEFFPALTSEDFLVLYARGLDQALRQRALWQQDGMDLQLSINMPADVLGDFRYYDATLQALQEHACPASRLMLEILETDEMSKSVDVAAALGIYKEVGISLAEDDLGSGHSSLQRMRELPFDTVKIDRSLVVLDDENSADVLHFIYQLTRLSHSLGKSVVVEGVEDEGLLEAVAILGADAIQGYVLTRPLPADRITEWLAEHRVYPEPARTHGILGQMARLLIWEECLYLLRAEAAAANDAAGIAPPALPFDSIDPDLQRVFMLAAINQGPSSPEYREIREQLLGALSARTV